MTDKTTAKQVQDNIAAYEKEAALNDPFDLGVQQFIKDAGIPEDAAKNVTAAIDTALVEFEKQSAGLEKQVGAFIDSVEAGLEKAGASNEQIAHAWINILQRMNK